MQNSLMIRFTKATLVLIFTIICFNASLAQCSICTKTAQQLGQGPASALNTGILYLMFAPLAIIGFLAYKWYKKEKQSGFIE